MKCPKCNYNNTETAIFCGRCGHPLEKEKHKKLRRKGIAILIVLIVILILGIVAGTWVLKSREKQPFMEKKEKVKRTTTEETSVTTEEEVSTEATTEVTRKIRDESTTESADQSNSYDPMEMYSEILYSGEYNYYALIDMNLDDTPELLVMQNESSIGGSAYPQDQILGDVVDVYYYDNGEVKLAESIGTSFDNLSYNSNDGRVRSTWGGSGYSQYIYYYLDESNQLQTLYLSACMDDDTFYYGEDTSEENEISESVYQSYLEEWEEREYIGFLEIR
ncbi:MAG: zinc ribbon domain-containing protein [Candidatus Fimousia sp.]